MNITDGIGYLRKRQAAQVNQLTVQLANVSVMGAAISISEAIANQKDIKARKSVTKAFDTVMNAIHHVKLQKLKGKDEETSFLQAAGGVLKDAAISLVGNAVGGLLKIMFRAVRLVVPPIVNIFLRTLALVAELAIPLMRMVLTNPIAATVALGAAAWVGYKWVNRKNEESGTQLPDFSTPYGTDYVSTIPEVALPSQTRGFRNNNPGNINFVGQTGATLETGPKGRFAVMRTQAEGLFLLSNQLELYADGGTDSIYTIIHKFAPKVENDTEKYIATVAKRMGVDSRESLDLLNRDVLIALMKAIIQFENGAQPYSDPQLNEAAMRAIYAALKRAGITPTIAAEGAFIVPAAGWLTSPFGHRDIAVKGASHDHEGVDIGAAEGTPILAANAGVVTKAGWSDTFGNVVQIDHGKGISTLYAHASRIYVVTGQEVGKGQTISAVGTTGRSERPHLHFEYHVNGTAVNPAQYIPQLDVPKQVAVTPMPMPMPKDSSVRNVHYIRKDKRIIEIRS